MPRLILMAGLALLLGGCLFERPVAPGNPEPLDTRLLGQWRCLVADSDEVGSFTVTQSAPRELRAVFGSGDDEPSVFIAHIVSRGGERLVNAREIVHGKPGLWTVARYTLYRPDLLHLEVLRDEPFEGVHDDAARTAILAAGLAGGSLFRDSCSCIRWRAP